jgi:hypothetical protein
MHGALPVRVRPLLAVAALGATLLLSASASAQCLSPRGDISGDGVTNILDIQCGIYVALNGEDNLIDPPACLGHPFVASDLNCDGATNVSDLLLMIQHAVGEAIDPSLDDDGDDCLDDCEVPGTLDGGLSIAGGTSTNSTFRLSAVGNGFESPTASGSASFNLRTRALGLEPAVE